MAMSALERKRKQLDREEQERKRMPDASYPFLKTPFFKYLDSDANWSNVEMNFDLMGLPTPVFADDSGPKSQSGEFDEPEVFAGYAGSVGRAEIMIEQLLDAATELATIVNRYKLLEIAARGKDLEKSDFAEPERRKAALDEAVRLSQLREALEKRVRRTLPEWSLKGV